MVIAAVIFQQKTNIIHLAKSSSKYYRPKRIWLKNGNYELNRRKEKGEKDYRVAQAETFAESNVVLDEMVHVETIAHIEL